MPSKKVKQYSSNIVRGILEKKSGNKINKNGLTIKYGKGKDSLFVKYQNEEGGTTDKVEKLLKGIFGINPYSSLEILTEKGEPKYGYEIFFELMPKKKDQQQESSLEKRIHQILAS